MQLGILGLAKSGKTTLFNILTAQRQETTKFAASKKTHVAVAKVPDPRLVKLRDLFNPRRYTPATVEYVDIPGIEAGAGQGAGRGAGSGAAGGSLDLAELRNVDALVHVVRAFEDPELPHPDGSVDPERDVATVDLELIFADHELMERRLARLEKQATGAGLSADERNQRRLIAEVVVPALEAERPLREIELSPEDEKRLRGFQLLSAKPMLVVLNVGEDRIAEAASDAADDAGPNLRRVTVSAPIEEEISRLEPEEQQEFLSDLGLEQPSLDRVLRASFELLGRIAFFTVGEDEVRAWTIRRGTRAREAGGAIHSDIERGFIRAEVIAWDDLLRVGSMAAAREQGILRLEGKDYVVRDGEICHFRFNV